MFRRRRFPGAGRSAEERFNRELRENVRAAWKVWVGFLVAILGFAGWGGLAGATAGRFLCFLSGVMFGVGVVVIALGGHISAFRWWLGAEGERETARQIERLSAGWHCEHDVVHEHGNWDHIVVGPPGTFLLDSKYLHGRAVARDDALDCGRLKFRGSGFRGGAWRIKTELEGRLGSSPGWVQAVVVVWADFPQRLVKENDVVYIAGEDLVAWLERQPIKLKGHQRTAIISALQELRAALDQAA